MEKEKLQVQSYRMAAETLYHQKEKYHDIIDFYKKLGPVESGEYLMAVINTMSFMSIEIFEHYKYLEGLFKQVLSSMLSKSECGKDKADLLRVSYSIMKACNMGVILQEKYEEKGMEICDSVLKNPDAEFVLEYTDLIALTLEQRMILFNK